MWLCLVFYGGALLLYLSRHPPDKSSRIWWLLKQLKPAGLFLIGAFLVVPVLAVIVGGYSAKSRVTFIVLDSDPNVVVLLDQGREMVCARFQRGNGNEGSAIVERRFRVVSLVGADAPSFAEEDLGHLKVVSTEEFDRRRQEGSDPSESPRNEKEADE